MNESSGSTKSPTGPPRFCTECGATLLPDSAFCSECGASVDEIGHTVSAAVKDSSLPTATATQTSPLSPPSGKKPSTMLVAIAGGAVLLIFLLAAGYFAYQHFSSNEGYIHEEDFPITFGQETLNQYSTPAQLVYFHVISEFYRGNGDSLTVGSPEISDLQVDIRLKFENTWENWRFVETENDGKRATVAVGLADAGAYEYYVLERQKGNWAITGALGVDGL